MHLPDSLLQGVTLARGTGGLGGEEEETCEEGHCISKEGKGSYSKHHHLHQCQQSVTLPNWSPLSPSSPPRTKERPSALKLEHFHFEISTLASSSQVPTSPATVCATEFPSWPKLVREHFRGPLSTGRRGLGLFCSLDSVSIREPLKPHFPTSAGLAQSTHS